MSHPSFVSFSSDNCPSPFIHTHYYEDDFAVGQDSNTIHNSAITGLEHFQFPIFRTMNEPLFRFYSLKSEWEKDTLLLSSVTEICTHPAYQQIIGMGIAALPFIFYELAKEPGHWFWALKSITGEDPVPSEKRGRMRDMTDIWLRWWINNKHKYKTSLSCFISYWK